MNLLVHVEESVLFIFICQIIVCANFAMRKPAMMLGMAAVGGVALYGLYSYLQRRKQKHTSDIIDDIVC